MAVSTIAGLNSLFNTIYDDALMIAREQNLMSNLVTVTGATGWADRVISTRPAITAVTVAETEDFNAPTTFGLTSKATITPTEAHSQVVMTQRDVETDPHQAMRMASIELGGSIATKVDVDLVTLFASATTDKGDGAGSAATLANMAAAISVLRYNKATQYGNLVAVWHPYHWHDFFVELGQPAATYPNLGDATNAAIREFWVSNLYACQHYISANIAIDGNDDAVSGVFVRDALMLDVRRPMNFEDERDASARAWEMNCNMGYGTGIVRQEFLMGFTADATEAA